MIIDKNGKLFGKINIIDLIIVIALIAVVALAAYSFAGSGEAEVSSGKAVIKFYAEEVTDFVLDGTINIGDPIIEVGTKNDMGTVTNVEIGDAVSYGEDSEGKWVQSSLPGHKSVLITAEVEGNEVPNGIEIKKAEYYIGHTMTIVAGKAKLHLRIYDLEFIK